MTGLLAGALAATAVLLSGRRPALRVGRSRRPPAAPYLLAGGAVLAGVVVADEPRVVVLAAIAGAAGVVGARLLARRRVDRRAAAVRLRVVELCATLHAELAAGQGPGQALARAAADWPLLDPVVRTAATNGDVPAALRELTPVPGAGDLRVVAAAWQVAHRTGHGLGDAVARVAEELRGAEQTRRVVTGELASARATARLVAGLPVVALLMGSGAGADPWAFLLGHPLGLACLAGGLGFVLARALLDRGPGPRRGAWPVTVLVAVAAGVAVALVVSRPERLPVRPEGPVARPSDRDDDGLLRRWRTAWALLAGAGTAVVLGGPVAPVAGALTGAVVWVIAGRVEPRGARLRREEVRRDLPHVVTLLGAGLRSGAAPSAAVDLACRALPGAAAERLRPVAARLELGADPAAVWGELADDPALGPLGRTMARTHRTGAPVVDAVDRLGEDLARRSRAEVEDRARAVGVRAAVPLGVCLLPAFLLLGIVPLVAGLASQIAW